MHTHSCLFHRRPRIKSQLSVRYLQALANMSTIFDNMQVFNQKKL
jgi:hypothetical protein